MDTQQTTTVSDSTTAEPTLPNETTPEEPEKRANSGSAFYRQKIADLEKRNQEMATRLESDKTNQLKEKENYKELWEVETKKRVEAEQKATRISESYLNGLKMSAIEQEALKAGIVPEAMSDIRIEEASIVEIETTDKGSVNILGAKEYVEQLKQNKFWLFNQGKAPVVNTHPSAQPSSPKELSPKELIALQKTDPKKYESEVKKKLGLA